MPSKKPSTTDPIPIVPTKYEYRTIDQLSQLIQPSGAKWCLYAVVKFCRQINENCMLVGICDPTSYGKGVKGASCLLYYRSFAGTIELPLQVEVGQLIRLHRMKITPYKPESGCIQLKSSNYYSWLLFDGKDDTSHDPIAQSSFTYSFSDDDRHKIDELRAWLKSFGDDQTLQTELDYQLLLPEEKSLHDQSTQTNENEKNVDGRKTDSESSEFFSAPDDIESPRKRLHTDRE